MRRELTRQRICDRSSTDRPNVNILLIEVSVVITIAWATTSYYLTKKWLRQKKAWQWWQAQQTRQLHQQAESIRDGLLQQAFAFRRDLENEPAAPNAARSDPEQTARWLARLQAFYQSLENLSNELSPPFVADSLPLALQFVVKDWMRSHPNLTLNFNAPPDWPEQSPDQNQLILSVVTALLTLSNPTENTVHLNVCLSQGSDRYALDLSLQGTDTQTYRAIVEKPETRHLKEIFHSLATGQLEINQEDMSLKCQLSWHAS